jgi:DNA-binding NarL/FixJ family response regulator
MYTKMYNIVYNTDSTKVGGQMASESLTPREKEVLRAYIEYETHEEASKHLAIANQTLKNHLAAIYRKLGRRKAHSALYEYTLRQGFDPFGPPATKEDPAQVVSVGVESASE